MNVSDVCRRLAEIAPLELAESWDNVGLLVGHRGAPVRRVMTCLSVTAEVVAESIAEQVDLLVTHHPLPFRPLDRLTDETTPGRRLLQLIAGNVAVYSAHTAYDSAVHGINDQWAKRLALSGVMPLVPIAESGGPVPNDAVSPGGGRFGDLPERRTTNDIARQIASWTTPLLPRVVGDPSRTVGRLGVACGSGGSFLDAAKAAGVEAFVTGEATFHVGLEAQASGIDLILLGHYASERFAMETLADTLAEQLPELSIWPSRREQDPRFQPSGSVSPT